MKVSVLVPVYNEVSTLAEIVRQIRATELDAEIVVVDDGSIDGTREVLQALEGLPEVRAIYHDGNCGKGAAVRTALEHATGDVLIIQDADLEYSPEDYPRLLKPIRDGRAKVVYGSRFIGEHRAMYYWHSVGNRLLTWSANVLFNTTLTDMETCYKVFTRDVAGKLKLQSKGWGIDPEITAKVLKRGYHIYEVPISYYGREYQEGKKISWKDFFTVLWCLLKYRCVE
jgi:glycosyltransferase involved in cell wall biosynthesis